MLEAEVNIDQDFVLACRRHWQPFIAFVSSFAMLIALPPIIGENLRWWIPGLIVFAGLVVYGLGDLLRFSFKRAWAISGVCFDESIRKRVLWITPLAIIGVILVSQLQKPIDEQDAIRQTIKFALFATGLVVVLTTIILACTNLPREIDTRVIYTVVAKPATRLEIVAGKVIGFAKVSLAILLIMGAFTFGYLHFRAWSLRRDIVQRLSAGTVDALARPTYEYWAREGLVGARTMKQPLEFQVYSREPSAEDSRRWFFGAGEGDIVVPFRIRPEDLVPPDAPGTRPGEAGVLVRIVLGYDRSEYGQPAAEAEEPSLQIGVSVPSQPTTAPSGPPRSATVGIQILDVNLYSLVEGRQINEGKPLVLNDPTGRTPVYAHIPPAAALNLLEAGTFYVNLIGLSGGVEYWADVRRDANPLNNPVCLIVPGATPQTSRIIAPMADPKSENLPALPTFRSRSSLYGQQLRGGRPGQAPVAVYRFRSAQPQVQGSSIGFELRTTIERSGESTEEEAAATRLSVVAVDRQAGLISGPVEIYPESNRTCYFSLPAAALRSGNFDLLVRNLTESHYVGLQRLSIAMVASEQSFNFNLIKSLLILWMLAILVVIISIFCSTFLSWPIATVLTLVILLGHWGVVQLGDALAPGIGNQIAQDMFGTGQSQASKARVVSRTVEAMAKTLQELSAILPDIEQFPAIEDIERGITISPGRLGGGLGVLLSFGLPMLTLSYVFLRNKEVAL